jgi:ATP synthase protein I
MDDQQPRKRASGSMADTMRTVGPLITVGFSFVFAIVIGAGLGWYLDKLFDTAPWLFLVFFAIGVAAGIRNVYRTAGRVLK